MSSTASSNPLYHPRYPRSTTYAPQWIFENQMGPNFLWVMEALTDVMAIKPRMRVLDLGCGTAMTSIFIAKEFGAEVWATDLWVGASENQARVRPAGVEDLVVPIHTEAHRLPFAEGFFDATVSVERLPVFGTADLYLGYITRFSAQTVRSEWSRPPSLPSSVRWSLRSSPHSGTGDPAASTAQRGGGRIGRRRGKVRVDAADAIEDGWKDWLRFDELSEPHLDGWRKEAAANSAAVLRADRGKHLVFSRIVATKL